MGHVAAFLLRVTAALSLAMGSHWLHVPALAAIPAALGVWALLSRRGPVGRRREPGRLLAVTGVAVMALLSTAGWSYGSYLAAPGAATFDIRTADWLRDHGFDPVVDAAEYWLYGRHAPGSGPIEPERLPNLPPPVDTVAASATQLPRLEPPEPVTVVLDDTLPGEGRWTPAGQLVGGAPVAYTTYLRPDPEHTRVLATVAWLDQNRVRTVYVPGTTEPGGDGWEWDSMVPLEERDQLVAAFNSGFKFKHIPGGVYAEGREPHDLIDGQASLVIDATGRVSLAVWGEDMDMADTPASVRQNLKPIVTGGRPAPGLMDTGPADWGKRRWQVRFTRRSGVGVTSTGALLYVSGNHLTLGTLADALVAAGATTAIQLDIHEKHPTFNFYQPAPDTNRRVTGAKLDPSMARSATRYLQPDQRDFFAVFVR